ncbi:hypothetical protein FFY61_04195 [Pediococcus acidilactici]|nr:hypothetical protein [Pediococcus acidilactici]MDB8861780.1 hypothetical protein [Pediococcus acidilactici]NBI14983.1 hypothetical protein [Pediococcus acidilactici]NFA45455.1 hypothetical protein [Pediococcus acidilactici]NFA48156.1 hypothetical protein [Pediococcus acidilactici]NFA88385.1 hypothetical protein [Pediococcus acidilactici]
MLSVETFWLVKRAKRRGCATRLIMNRLLSVNETQEVYDLNIVASKVVPRFGVFILRATVFFILGGKNGKKIK